MIWKKISLIANQQQKEDAELLIWEAAANGELLGHCVLPIDGEAGETCYFVAVFLQPGKGKKLLAALSEIDEFVKSEKVAGTQELDFFLPDYEPPQAQTRGEPAPAEPRQEPQATAQEPQGEPAEDHPPEEDKIPFVRNIRAKKKPYTSARNRRGRTIEEEVFYHFRGKGRFFLQEARDYLSDLDIGDDEKYKPASASPAISHLVWNGLAREDNLPGQKGWFIIDADTQYVKVNSKGSKPEDEKAA